jgi:hypothetical protein
MIEPHLCSIRSADFVRENYLRLSLPTNVAVGA